MVLNYFNNIFSNKAFRDLGGIILSSLALLFWAFYNDYPLFFSSDTAMYLEAAFAKNVGPDRPILYGLFMYYISAKHSLWFVVIIQSLILSILFYCWFRYFSNSSNYLKYYLSFMVLISFFMGASFNASWLMPDIFAPISILSIGLLLFSSKLPKPVLIFLIILSIVSIAMHNSHLYINLGILLIFIVLYCFKTIRELLKKSEIKFNRLILITIIIISSTIFSSTINYFHNGGFKSSQGGTIFLMGSLVEMGIVDTYLGENCERKQFSICDYKDTIPNNFLWASNSPIYKTGGWIVSEDEYSEIVKDILTTPKYLKSVIWKSAIRTFSQFMHFDTGEATAATPRINQAFSRFYPNEYDKYYYAKQNQNKLNFNIVNHLQVIIFLFSIFIYVWFYHKKIELKYRLLILYILLSLIINAWVCGTFSGVYFRYQARVLWLIPLPIFLYIMNFHNSFSIKYFINNKKQ